MTNRRIEPPVYFKYYTDKNKISGHLSKLNHGLYPLPGLTLLAKRDRERHSCIPGTSLGETELLFFLCACVVTEVRSPGWGGGPI